MSLSLPFHQVDVFTSVAYKGNPVAVVVAFKDPSITLTDEQMASFANWTNLSETTFILPPSDPSSKADYRLRIFTTQYELPFAGHPTIGSCEAFLAAGGVPKVAGKVVQECGLGLISLQVDSSNDSIYFAAPPLSRSGDIDAKTRETACKAMHIDPKSVASAVWIDNGPPWFALELKDAQAVLDVNVKAVSGNDDHGDGVDFMWGIWGTYEQGKGPNGASVEVRTFFDRGQNEDPVTGSFAAGLATYRSTLAVPGSIKKDYIISQGTKLGRKGNIHVKHEEGTNTIWIGGQATVCISGNVVF